MLFNADFAVPLSISDKAISIYSGYFIIYIDVANAVHFMASKNNNLMQILVGRTSAFNKGNRAALPHFTIHNLMWRGCFAAVYQ